MKMALALVLTFAASAALAEGATTTTSTTTTETTNSKMATAPETGKMAGHDKMANGKMAGHDKMAMSGETMTVEGSIAKVVPAKKEIYVQAADKKHEFYFKPTTELTQNGQAADFATLKEGTKVRVEYTKVGKRMDPVKVEILQ